MYFSFFWSFRTWWRYCTLSVSVLWFQNFYLKDNLHYSINFFGIFQFLNNDRTTNPYLASFCSIINNTVPVKQILRKNIVLSILFSLCRSDTSSKSKQWLFNVLFVLFWFICHFLIINSLFYNKIDISKIK